MNNIETIIALISAIIAVLSVIFSVILSLSDRGKDDYLAIDEQYKDILKEGMKNPALRDPKMCCKYDSYKETDREFYLKYNTYAYIVWNFLETIFDFSHDKKEKHRRLYEIFLPAIIQENKLHYHWFRLNNYLFEASFQDFVFNIVNQLEINECNLAEFKTVYDMMLKEFPPEEVKNRKQMISLLVHGKYKAYLARLKNRIAGDNTFVGYALGYLDNDCNAFFLDYIQISSDFQNCGFGSQFLHLLQENVVKGENPIGILFEIEKPDDGGTGTKSKRLKFYMSNGAHKLNFDYYLPVPVEQGTKYPLDLMFIPKPNVEKVSKETLKEFIIQAETTIHSDYSHTKDVIASYIDSVPDFEKNSNIHVIKGSKVDLDYVYDFLDEHFDSSFIIPKSVFEKRISESGYELVLAKNNYNVLVGYAFVYRSKDKKFLYLDYFAILPFFRQQGYGTLFLNELLKNGNRIAEYGIFSEVPCIIEPYVEKLIKKCGGKLYDIKYSLPVGKGKVELRSVVYPKPNFEELNSNDIKDIYKEVLLNLHGDTINENNLKDCIS